MNIFITGSNRGIGLEFVNQYLSQGDRVFASCRNPLNAKKLQKLRNNYPDQLTILPLDVTNQKAIESARDTLKNHVSHLDLLINNAGIGSGSLPAGKQNLYNTLEYLDPQALEGMFLINSLAPTMVARTFIELLKRSDKPKVINISSIMGSIEHNMSGSQYGYKASKAALNMLTRTLAFDLKPDKIVTVVVHPGWVQTDMGGSHATLTPQESVSSMIPLIQGFGLAQTGRFFNYNGQELNW